jgi:hypothetical protein
LFGVVADNLVCSNKDEECLLEIIIRSLCALLVVPAGDVLGFSFVHNGCQSVHLLVMEFAPSLLNLIQHY